MPVAAPGDTVAEVRSRLAGRSFDAAGYIVVLDGGRAVGLIGLEALLAATDDQSVSGLTRGDPPAVPEDTDQEIAAHRMIDATE